MSRFVQAGLTTKEENAQRAPRGRQLFAFLYFKSRVKALQTKDEPLCHAFVTKFYLWKSREWEGRPPTALL